MPSNNYIDFVKTIRNLESLAGTLDSSFPLTLNELLSDEWNKSKWDMFVKYAVANFTLKINDEDLSRFVFELLENKNTSWENIQFARAALINHPKFKDLIDE